MKLSSEHDPKYLRLGLILVFTGFLFALIFVTRVNARELSPQIYDTEAVLVYDNDPLVFYGCDHALYFYQDSYTDELLLSSSFNPESQQLYDFWYGSRFSDSDYSWGYSPFSYSVLKGHIINLMGQTNYFTLPQGDTIANVELKEIDLDDSYVAFYFMDSNFNYYCYVSYIPQNSETLQPDYPFDSFSINDSGHFVEQDPVYRELFVWDSSNQRWIYSSVSSSNVVVHTVLRFPYAVKLEAGAQVYVEASRFLIDYPLPTATPTPSPTPDPNTVSSFGFLGYFTYSSMYYYVEVSGNNIFKSVTLDINDSDVAAAMSSIGTTDPNTVFGKSVYLSNTYASGSSINWSAPFSFLYFTGDDISAKVWRLGSSLISDDVSYIKANYNFVSLDSNNNTSSYPYFSLNQVGDLNCIVISYDAYRNTGSYNVVNNYGYNIDVLDSYSSSNRLYYASVQLQKAYAALLTRAEEPVPTQDPNVSPTPTPTEAPHVIVTWPTGTPTPTPPIILPTSPLIPPGDGITPLDPELQDDVFGVFKSKIGDNNSFGLFGLLIGLLPGDLMWYIWFLLFVLLVVGVAKLIIHFTGG